MITQIVNKIPNTTNDNNGSEAFNKFIKDNQIKCNESEAIQSYQGVGNRASKDHGINHCLALLFYNEESNYAKMSSNIYGSFEDCSDYHPFLTLLEKEFSNNTYSFNCDSKVYKGLDLNKPYYECLNLLKANVGDEITFSGYLSTTASEDKAITFLNGSSNNVCLVISGLQNACCIVPINSNIKGTINANTPEQEVLLNKKTKCIIINIDKNVIYLEVQK